MKYSQAKPGRIFVIRLEHGDIVHEEIEKFARDNKVNAAALIILGGADRGSKIVVGPENANANLIIPITHILNDVNEIAGTGTLFPDDTGNPMLHMHMAFGRSTSAFTGCIRSGVKVWQVMEVILFELVDAAGVRLMDPATGLKLLSG